MAVTEGEKTTEDQILVAVRDRLASRISEWSRNTVLISDDPVPLEVPPGDTFCTVSVGDSVFPVEFFSGAGEATLVESGQLIVAPYSRVALDTIESIEQMLTAPERGMLRKFKLQILKALIKEAYDPEDSSNFILRNQLRPMNCQAARPVESRDGEQYMALRLTFEMTFDWDLNA